MAKSRWDDPDDGHATWYLKAHTERPRSTRPLAHKLRGFSIEDLYYMNMLHVGCNTRTVVQEGVSLTTTLASEHPKFKIRMRKQVFIYDLVSRPFGKRLAWFFRDPATGRLVKSIYIFEGKVGSRAALDGLYASQFQSKTYRQLMRMDKLILAIEGNKVSHVGPARGKSRLRKLAHLRRLFAEVRSADRQREKVLAKFPQFERTISVAKALLKREIPKLPKGWDAIEGLKTARMTQATRRVISTPSVSSK
jgi:hypothetical protein